MGELLLMSNRGRVEELRHVDPAENRAGPGALYEIVKKSVPSLGDKWR